LNDPYFIIIPNLVNLMIHEQMTHHIFYFWKKFHNMWNKKTCPM